MAVSKLSVAPSETVARQASAAASRRGLSLSTWLNESAQNSLRVEAGLAAVAEWEAEHGTFRLKNWQKQTPFSTAGSGGVGWPRERLHLRFLGLPEPGVGATVDC